MIKIFRCGTCHKQFPAESDANKWTVGWCHQCKRERRIYFVRNDE